MWTDHPDLLVPVSLARSKFFVSFPLLSGASWLFIAVFVVFCWFLGRFGAVFPCGWPVFGSPFVRLISLGLCWSG